MSGQTYTPGASNGNTVLFDHVNSTENPRAVCAYGTAETDLDWTLGTAADSIQAWLSFPVFDVSAPTLTNADYSGLTSFAVTPQVDTDDATGNMYQVICLASVAAPNATQVVAGTDGDGNAPVDSEILPTSGTGTQTFSSTGNILTPGTNYVIYYAQVDGGALVSNAPSKAFTTTGTTQVGNVELVHTVGGEIDQVIPAPILTNLKITDITYKNIVVTVETDTDNGSLSLVVVPDGDSPTVDQIKQGLQSDGTAAIARATKPVFAIGEQSFGTIFVSNDGSTPYEVYVVHTNITNTSSLSVTDGFTTLEAPAGTVPNIEAYIKLQRNIDAGSDDPVTIYFEQPFDATYTDYYCMGRTDFFQGKAMWVRLTTTDNAEVKAAEVIEVMRALDSDPDVGP